MDFRARFALAVATGASALAGCRAPAEEVPRAPAVAPAPRVPVVALDPTAEEEGLPSLSGLSDAGLLALKLLAETPRFTDVAVGEGGETPLAVEAWRILDREKDGLAAFRYLAHRDALPAKLFGLCGLWLRDRAAFQGDVGDLREAGDDATVATHFGCILDETPLAEVLAKIDDGTYPKAFRGTTGRGEQ